LLKHLDKQSFSSISEASQILGVSETALRHWTDEGKIKAFITPGGHRRYEITELKRFIGAQPKTPGIKQLVEELENTTALHREIVRSDNLANDSRVTGYRPPFDDDAVKQLADLGRRLHYAIISYVNKPRQREATLELVREIGGSFGHTLATLGLPLTDAVTAFVRHRGPIMDAVTQTMKHHEFVSQSVAEAPALVARVMDEALLALVAAHQEAFKVTP
jgi:excisionase family DNA binding protein